MTKEDAKQKALDLLPAVAVFGITALAVYGITKVVKSVKDIDFPLDFGYDEHLGNILRK
jgi:hypothetical protein